MCEGGVCGNGVYTLVKVVLLVMVDVRCVKVVLLVMVDIRSVKD